MTTCEPALSVIFATRRLCVKPPALGACWLVALLLVLFSAGSPVFAQRLPSAPSREVVTLIDDETPVETSERDVARQTLTVSITIFVLAIFVGFELITKIPATLHTPLMSGSNAISGITVVGAIIAAGASVGIAPFLGFVAVVLAMINVVGGFLVTHRMLKMFRRN